MFGLDDTIASVSDGASLLIVLGVAVLLGLRHASDPDHLVAVTALVAASRKPTRWAAGKLGMGWGLGHATTLVAFGLPIVLFKAYLPEHAVQGAEVLIGAVIVALAAWLLARWRQGLFHMHVHDHGSGRHAHGHTHERARDHPHRSGLRARSPLQAYGIGLVHGVGGSAGVGVLLLASIDDQVVAVLAMALFALFTALSMALLSAGFGTALSGGPVRRWFHRLAPALGVASLAFGAWYALGALDIVPYYA
jgi:high-affinity nickel permease